MNDLLCGDQKICNASLRFFVPDSYSDGALFLVNGRGGPLSELYFQIPSFPSFMNASQYNRPSYTGTSYSIIDETLVRPALQYMATGMGILALCCMALVCLLVMGKPNKVGKALYWLMVLGLACEIGLGASSVWLCMYGSISAPQIALAGGRWNSSFSTGWYAASGFRETLTVLALLFAQLVLFIQGRGILVQLKTKRTKILYTAILVWFLLLAFVPIVLRVVILGLYFESLNPDSTLGADNYILELSGIFVGDLLTQIQNIAQRLSLGLWCTLSLIQAVKSQLLGRRRMDNAGVQAWAGRVLHDTMLFIVSSHIIPLALCGASIVGTGVDLWATASILALTPLISLLPADVYNLKPVHDTTGENNRGGNPTRPSTSLVAGEKCHDDDGSQLNTLSKSRLVDHYDRQTGADSIELDTILSSREMG